VSVEFTENLRVLLLCEGIIIDISLSRDCFYHISGGKTLIDERFSCKTRSDGFFVDQHFLDRKTCVGNLPPRSPDFILFDLYDLGFHERSDLLAIITKYCVLLQQKFSTMLDSKAVV
jgi:hypothetical protein